MRGRVVAAERKRYAAEFMGLFSNVIHCWHTDREAVIDAVDRALRNTGFNRHERAAVPPEGPTQSLEAVGPGERPVYFVSTRVGDWVTVIEGGYVGSAPDTAALAQQVSEALETYTMSLLVHDDDLMLYNLFGSGRELDGYNSWPQYFENDRLSEEYIEDQRHSPEELRSVLPIGTDAKQVVALLNRGWWGAHDSGRLDGDGVEPEESDGFVFEGERMTAFGTLLKLHGYDGPYPYSAWREDPGIKWNDFEVLVYSPAV